MLTGACTALTLQFVERGVARPPPQAADVTFTLSPPVGRLSSTATCADNVDTLPLSPSTGTLRVYLKTSTAGVVQVQATSVLGVADASVRSKPLVLLLKSSTTPSNFYDDDDSPVVFRPSQGRAPVRRTRWTRSTPLAPRPSFR